MARTCLQDDLGGRSFLKKAEAGRAAGALEDHAISLVDTVQREHALDVSMAMRLYSVMDGSRLGW